MHILFKAARICIRSSFSLRASQARNNPPSHHSLPQPEQAELLKKESHSVTSGNKSTPRRTQAAVNGPSGHPDRDLNAAILHDQAACKTSAKIPPKDTAIPNPNPPQFLPDCFQILRA
jgi:hypothetical protein